MKTLFLVGIFLFSSSTLSAQMVTCFEDEALTDLAFEVTKRTNHYGIERPVFDIKKNYEVGSSGRLLAGAYDDDSRFEEIDTWDCTDGYGLVFWFNDKSDRRLAQLEFECAIDSAGNFSSRVGPGQFFCRTNPL